ncbi:plasminogen-binding group A streptococcal M-like protein PAM [Littorina saxatilis]|uniref:plasminogen-binding group A streptococcal M-like protein PAM n=1 Tax=Littorina saxatilis TaxID=31220 RepID=UPI0038B56AC4
MDDKAAREELDRETEDLHMKEGELNKVQKENRRNIAKLMATTKILAHLKAKLSDKEQHIAECQKKMKEKLNTQTNEANKWSRRAEANQRLADKLTKEVKSLTAALDAVKEQKALCEVVVNKGQTYRDNLQRHLADINARYAKLEQVNEQQDSKIQELKAELESLQKQPAHLGERCSEANRYCVKGLGCNGSGVCGMYTLILSSSSLGFVTDLS